MLIDEVKTMLSLIPKTCKNHGHSVLKDLM